MSLWALLAGVRPSRADKVVLGGLLSALAAMPAWSGPGKVCLDGVTPLATCAKTIGTYYANSPPLRKFVDTLPGLTPTGVNTFNSRQPGEYIPVGTPNTSSYPGSDYYVIGAVEHEQWMHSDLPKATRQRSFVQLYDQGVMPPPSATALSFPNGIAIRWPDGSQVYAYDKPHYLGPILITNKDRPVRVKLVNLLPVGAATVSNGIVTRNGDMFLPVDESLAGAGLADGINTFSQARMELHLHGGDNIWISDGTPHQWITPLADPSPYKRGPLALNVPDMVDPGPGAMTYFWPNGQTSRLLWYHDHTFGLTRQNAYAGAAAAYLLVDPAELALLNGGAVNGVPIAKALPGQLMDQIVLVIQDKTFVPNDIAVQDSKWDVNAWGQPGDLWFPHVYEPVQLWDTLSAAGQLQPAMVNPAGRWDYAVDTFGGYLPPRVPLRQDADFGAVSFPDGSYLGGASSTPESYMDTAMVNGVAYPVLNVEPKAYRVRFLNAANDRFFNLSLWLADGATTSTDGRTNTEVLSVPADGSPYTLADGTIVTVPNDGRPGGVPDPRTAGPDVLRFASEGGLLPRLAVHHAKPITGVGDPVNGFMEVRGDDFYLGNAERADTVIDFSAFAGKTLILYNDSSAPVPGGDPRYDHFTGNPDLTSSGGAPSTQAGFGPNTRTIMQIQVASAVAGSTIPAAPFDGVLLASELAKAYAATADPMPLPPATKAATAINLATRTLTLADGSSVPLQVKTIEGFTDPNMGRLIAQLGVELPDTSGQLVATPLTYVDKATEVIDLSNPDSAAQYWLIKNNDADNHPMHFHLFNVQVVARYDTLSGQLVPPQFDESGWKDTVKNWPGEDVIVALRPKTPLAPFGLPNSQRLMDPSLPAGAQDATGEYRPGQLPFAFAQFDVNTGVPSPTVVVNAVQDYGWEYVWHCHILGHEENDLMRPIIFRPLVSAPAAPSALSVTSAGLVAWADGTPAGGSDAQGVATMGNAANEIGFRVERAAVINGVVGSFLPLQASAGFLVPQVNTLANATSFQDKPGANTDYRYRVVAVNGTGESPAAGIASLTQMPAAPSGLTATSTPTAPGVTLNWVDNASNETGYDVQRNGTVIASLATNSGSYYDTTVLPSTSYSYAVVARNPAGSAASGAALITSQGPVLNAPDTLSASYSSASGTATLAWKDTSYAETGYVVQRATAKVDNVTGAVTWGADANRPTASSILAANLASFSDTVANNNMYRYKVGAVNGAAPGPVSSIVVVSSVSLPTPGKLQLKGNPTASSFVMQWQNLTSNVVTGYELQWCAGTTAQCAVSPAVSWLPAKPVSLAGANTSSYTVAGLNTKTTYSVRVRAVNAIVPAINSAWSTLIAVTTK